jgi:DNA replication ATP-dependent helicase Dna2
MSNDNNINVNPGFNADGESDEKCECLYSNEMTQDVIEWDESRNMDLGQMFKSPQPPGSSGSKVSKRGGTGTKGRNTMATITATNNGSKSNTPSSTSTNNSSLFAGVKRQLREIGGIPSAPNRIDGSTSSTVDNIEGRDAILELLSPNSLGQMQKRDRHRRRRLGYPQEHPNERTTSNIMSASVTLASATATAGTGIVLQPQYATASTDNFASPLEKNAEPTNAKKLEATRHDDFAELLDAITTPNSSSGPGKPSRAPLSPVYQNNIISSIPNTTTENSTERRGAGFCKSTNGTQKKPQLPPTMTHSFPQPNFDEILPVHNTPVEEDQMCKSHQSHQPTPSGKVEDNASDQKKCDSSGNHNDKCQTLDDDEFGEIEFSESDLAKLDSVPHSIPSRRMIKQPDHPVVELPTHRENCMENKTKVSTKTTPSVTDIDVFNSKKANETNHSSCIKKEASDDEFGEFPSDTDFAEIDAMVSTQPLIPNAEQSVHPEKSAVQPQEATSLEISASVMDTSNTSCNNSKQKEERTEREDDDEDDDEFGSFPDDVDFSQVDALVATQCCPSKSTDSKMIAGHLNKAKDNISSLEGKSPMSKSDDEFGEFPDDVDFNILDQVVTETMVARRSMKIDPSAPVRNQRTSRHDCGELSFMKFSRYKVLAVDTDERNCTNILRVASWINSMAESDEVMKKILKDGKVKKSGCHDHGDGNGCIFTSEKDIDYPEDGLLYLCGEWSFTPVTPGDVIHVCSLTGQYKTDATALPIVLHSYPPPGSDVDDLILVLHPDMLMSPSIISETSSCNRRAALKSKIGSNGLSSKAAFVGTMRHGLFEACMKTAEFDSFFAQREVKKLLREKAEMLIGCNVSESEAEAEILGILPMIRQFAQEYTTLRKDVMMLSSLGKTVGGVACHPDIRLLVKGVHSVEENIVSASLGLKGSIDGVLEAESRTIGHKHGGPSSTNALNNLNNSTPQQSLMCLELKTGHNQNVQNAHMAQLSLYAYMLQSRYGTRVELDDNLHTGLQSQQKTSVKGGAPGGILLYLNDKSQQICHVSPQMNEVKTLMSQRNVVASDSKRALRPRGIGLSYEEGNGKENEEYLTAKLLPAPTAVLPELKASSHSCKRCFSNRECMLYAASDSTADLESHRDLLLQFTGHLKDEDLEYFRKWDRLIDIEAESSNTKASTPWLVDSRIRERENGESISGMIFEIDSSYKVGTSRALVCFRRKTDTGSQSSFENLNVKHGSQVIVSTDGTLLDHFKRSTSPKRQLQNRMHITKGSIERIEEDKVFISTTYDEMNQIKLLSSRYQDIAQQSTTGNFSSDSLLFRLDKNTNSVGTGTLRWNLINFLTSDYAVRDKTERTELDRIKQRRLTWLRDVVVRLQAPEFAEDPHSSLFHGIDLHIPGCNLLELSEEFSLLNEAQQMAVKKVMSGRDYTLIQGLPGTGKTSTLAFLARLLVARGRRVLVTAYTHSAVDNIMSKLIEKGMGSRKSKSGMSALVRLGGSRRPCHESVKPIIHFELALQLDKISENRNTDVERTHADADHPSAASLKEVVAMSRVLGVSALSLPRSPLLQSEIFDVVIIDEAGQMNEPTALGALAAADSFVLVGDHKQLPPLVNSSIADRGGYGISILKRLADQHPHAIAPLTMQYRMNEAICKISSESIYGGQLQCGNDKIRSQLLNLPAFPSSLPTPSTEGSIAWLHSVIDPEQPIVFVDTDSIIEKNDTGKPNAHREEFMALEGKAGGSIVNRTEAKLVWHILEAMQLCGHDLSEIGVISPFNAQIRVMEDNAAVIPWKKKGLEMSTIDKYQGRDKSTIILSLVRSNKNNKAGRLLQDARRLNVAFTRAKCKLIVIGSFRTLSTGSAPLKPILNRMDMRKQRLKLPANAMHCYNII